MLTTARCLTCLEEVVAKHLKCLLNSRRLHRNHSTETVLLEVHRDIGETQNNKYIAGLVLLDLAYFDVVDQGILQKLMIFWTD